MLCCYLGEDTFQQKAYPLCIQFLKCRPNVRQILTNRWRITYLANRWRITYNDFRLFTLFPNSPAHVFTSRPKLKSILSKNVVDLILSHLTPDKAKEFEFLRFNHPRYIRPTPKYPSLHFVHRVGVSACHPPCLRERHI